MNTINIDEIMYNNLNKVSKTFAFKQKIKVSINTQITQEYTDETNPYSYNQKREYIDNYLFCNIQNSGKSLYRKDSDGAITKYDIRVDAYIDKSQPFLKHNDIIHFNTKSYKVLEIEDKSNTGHVIYYCNQTRRI